MKIIILFFVLAGMMYSQGLTGHYSSLLKKRATAGAAYTTDSLKWYWDDDDLSNGAIQTWTDQIASLVFTQNTEDDRATMTDSGLVFGGDDFYTSGSTGNIDSTVTVEMLIKLSSAQDVYRDILQLYTDVGQFNIYSNDQIRFRMGSTVSGGVTRSARYPMSVMDTTALQHLVVTDEGDSIRLYINGVKRTPTAVNQMNGGNAGGVFRLGGSINYLPSGTIVRLIRFYNKALTQEEVTKNYNHSSVQGKLE